MTKKIYFKGKEITVNFYQKYEQLVLESWDTTDPVPCRVEADYIESHIKDWLEVEFSENYTNYVDNYIASLEEHKYDYDKENF